MSLGRAVVLGAVMAAVSGCVDSGHTSDSPGPTGDGPLPPDVQAVVDRGSGPLFECPERIWPGAAEAFRSGQVLLTTTRLGDAYLWNDRSASFGEEHRITVVDAGTLDDAWFSSFNIGTYRNAVTLGISLQGLAEIDAFLEEMGVLRWHGMAVNLLFHEGFHGLVQPTWPRGPGGSVARGVAYPEQALPRYLRAELSRALISELEQPSGLGPAAYWYGRFTNEAAADAAGMRSVDTFEGTAQYATLVASALAELGCGADEAELHAAALAHLDEFASNSAFEGEYEAYALGALAGLTLRRDGRAGWEAAAVSGTPPAESLLASVAQVTVPEDATLRAAVEQQVAARNQMVASAVDELLARLSSADYYRLPVSVAWVVGSFAPSGFLRLVDEPEQRQVTLDIYAELAVPPSGVRVSLTEMTAIAATGALPCAGDFSFGWILTVPKASVTLVRDRYMAVDSEIRFTGLPATVVREGELDWLCP